jgi:uncharacterized integral membrane protein
MSTRSSLEEHIVQAGITYGRRHDISYRIGLMMQVLGSAMLAVLYPLGSPFYTVGIMLFEAGVFLAAVYLLVWKSWIKKIILASVLTGFVLQCLGFYAPEEYAGSVIIGGIGMICAGAAGMAGKEAYCFRYWEGWILMLLGFPLMVLENLLGRENHVFNSIGFSFLFVVLLSLAGKKLREPLLSFCSPNDCNPKRSKS